MEYFYDNQIRRYLEQVVRIFSNFKVKVGDSADGYPIYRTVPVNYGDISRMAGHILKNNSENVLNTAPFFSVYITDMSMAPERRTYQQYKENSVVTEKKFNEVTGEYINEEGERYQITRHNPVPYNMTINLDIWTTNTDQKLQLYEQVSMLFNPDINLKTNSNPVDWSSLTYMEMINQNWSGRSIPSGTDEVIDIASFQFKIPILLNPPTKVRRETLIKTIINKLDVVDEENLKFFDANEPFETQYRSYNIITFGDYKVSFTGDTAILLGSNGNTEDDEGNPHDWDFVLKQYGVLREGISQLRLRMTNDINDDTNDVVATIDSINQNEMYLTVNEDTLPANTLDAIDGIINPQENYPDDGVLSNVSNGQRYLLTNDTPDGTIWDIDAEKNDIIEYNSGQWIVSFDSRNNEDIERVYDLDSENQYEWDGQVWKTSYTGIYNQGYWRVYL